MLVHIALPLSVKGSVVLRSKEVGGFVREIVKRWGGCTTTHSVGHWVSGEGEEVVEPIKFVRVWCQEQNLSVENWWLNFAVRVGEELRQDSVYLEFSDARVVFV